MEQAGAEPSAFVMQVDTKAGEEGDGLRITAAAFAEPGWSLGGVELRHAPAVVGDDVEGADFGDDEDPGCADGGGLSGVAAEPQGLLRGPALEMVDNVVVP